MLGKSGVQSNTKLAASSPFFFFFPLSSLQPEHTAVGNPRCGSRVQREFLEKHSHFGSDVGKGALNT